MSNIVVTVKELSPPPQNSGCWDGCIAMLAVLGHLVLLLSCGLFMYLTY